jgi:hypothetical protein
MVGRKRTSSKSPDPARLPPDFHTEILDTPDNLKSEAKRSPAKRRAFRFYAEWQTTCGSKSRLK